MSAKILLFSDSHIHPHKNKIDRLYDCLAALEWVFTKSISMGINHLVFLGDLFHDRQKIWTMTYQKTYELFQRYSPQFSSIHLLVGNHDMWFQDNWSITSLKPFSSIPKITVIDHPQTISINNLNIDFLPYTKDPLPYLKGFTNPSAILCGHLAIDGAILNSVYNTLSQLELVEHDGEMVKISAELFSKWKRVFLGHYHGAQIIDDLIEYVGSPLELSFGEAGQEKHLLVLDTVNLTREYIVNDFSPRHIIVKSLEELADLPNTKNFIRLEVENVDNIAINQVKKQLGDSVKFLEVKERKVQEKESEKQSFNLSGVNDNFLESYIKFTNANNLCSKKLLELGNYFCHEE